MRGLLNTQTKRKTLFTIVACLILLTSLTGPALANSHGSSTGLICGDGDAAGDAQQLFRFLLSIYMFFGFVFGLVYFAAGHTEDIITGYSPEWNPLGDIDGKDALVKAFTIPLLIYFFDFVSEPLFGLNISCIVPSL